MPTTRAITDVLAGTDARIRRQIGYWAATLTVYSICVALLWSEVWAGAAAAEPAS